MTIIMADSGFFGWWWKRNKKQKEFIRILVAQINSKIQRCKFFVHLSVNLACKQKKKWKEGRKIWNFFSVKKRKKIAINFSFRQGKQFCFSILQFSLNTNIQKSHKKRKKESLVQSTHISLFWIAFFKFVDLLWKKNQGKFRKKEKNGGILPEQSDKINLKQIFFV